MWQQFFVVLEQEATHNMTKSLVITSRETNFNKCLWILHIGLLDYYDLEQDNLQYQMELSDDKIVIHRHPSVDA